MTEQTLNGLVTCLRSGFYEVETPAGRYTCHLRGRLKRGPSQRDLVALGDRVRIEVVSSENGMIAEIEPRFRSLERLAPAPQGATRQVLVANLDQLVLVFACTRPEPHLRMLDRFLVVAERQQLPALIVVNKVDLLDPESVRSRFDLYTHIHYPVFYTSVANGSGIEALMEQLHGKTSALAGPSGVGKTSLLNALQPGLGLAVREVSKQTERGQHTTVVRRIHALADGGYVADLPGLKSLALWDLEPEELDGYFPELRPLVRYCQFSDCTHQHEPGCAVRAAVEKGEVHPLRYESYLRMRFGEEE